jgi:PKD repeat protein
MESDKNQNNFTPPPITVEAMVVENENQINSQAGFETNAANTANTPVVKKGPNRLVFIALGLGGLILMILISAVFLVLSGGPDNPLVNSLGLTGNLVSSIVFISLAMFFGLLSMTGLIASLLGVFKIMNTAKEDKKTKKKFAIVAAAGVLALVLGLGGLIYSVNTLTNKPNLTVSSFITTNPAETTGLTAPTTIIFDAENLPIDTSKYKIISYNWSFGDSEVATGQTVTHTFTSKPASGIYTVTLKVSFQDINNPNAEILEEQFTKVISIKNEQVFATFTFSPDQGQAPLEVSFDASKSKDPDGQIVNYEWDFNEDGITDAEGVKVKYTFKEVGAYNVTLTVTDNNGESNSENNTVTVKSDQIILAEIKNFPEDAVLTPGRAYQFDASTSTSTEGTINKYEWNFGNGKTGVGKKVTQTYDREGVYELSLTLTDDAGNTRVYTKNYTVSNSPSGLFAKIVTTPAAPANGIIAGTAPLRISFDAGSSSGADIVDYKWDFNNDGITDANGQQVEHVFTRSGDFDAVLTIASSDNKTAKVVQKVSVKGSGLEAQISANPVNGIVPLSVTFDATATRVPENESIVAFRWDFGDGTPLLTEGPIVTHKFNTIGTFTVKGTAITATNKNSTAEITIIVTSTPLKSCYTVSRKVGPAPMTVSFNPQCSTGTISSYAWKFGSLGVSNERRPDYTFTTPGTYEVELEISDSGNNISVFKDTIIVE